MLLAYDKINIFLKENNIPFVDIRDQMVMKKSNHKFAGSLNRKIFNLFPNDEHLPYFELKHPIKFQRFEEGKEVEAAIFHKGSKYYSFYMGGDNPYTKITTNRENLPNILVIGDSTSNALETLLWCSANNFVSVDFRHYKEKNAFEVIDLEKPTIVIFSMINGYYSNPSQILSN